VYSEIPVFIEASDSKGLSLLSDSCNIIFGTSHVLDSDRRSILHLAAVFACNFTNASLVAAQEIAEKNGIDFQVLLPLISETFSKNLKNRPFQNQTGPAMRHNNQIIGKHLEMLSSNPSLKMMYEAITRYITDTYKS
jgi:predicted short-subunit dehydrogenase-like oxidoreductase (DUF2520 family)